MIKNILILTLAAAAIAGATSTPARADEIRIEVYRGDCRCDRPHSHYGDDPRTRETRYRREDRGRDRDRRIVDLIVRVAERLIDRERERRRSERDERPRSEAPRSDERRKPVDEETR